MKLCINCIHFQYSPLFSQQDSAQAVFAKCTAPELIKTFKSNPVTGVPDTGGYDYCHVQREYGLCKESGLLYKAKNEPNENLNTRTT